MSVEVGPLRPFEDKKMTSLRMSGRVGRTNIKAPIIFENNSDSFELKGLPGGR